MYEFLANGLLSLLELPDNDDTVRLLPLLLDPDKVDTLDLEERPDSDPDPNPDLEADLDPSDPTDLTVRPVLDDRPDLDVRPDLYVRSDLEEMPDTSEPDFDDSSEIEDNLVLEVISDTVDRAVVDLVCSGSCSCWTLITLSRKMHYYQGCSAHLKSKQKLLHVNSCSSHKCFKIVQICGSQAH